MDRLFNMDNKFFTVMGRVADLIMLNVVFLICCLPIVTIGASLTALHYVTLKMARNEESYIIRSFFKSFKQNFKQATVINLIICKQNNNSIPEDFQINNGKPDAVFNY